MWMDICDLQDSINSQDEGGMRSSPRWLQASGIFYRFSFSPLSCPRAICCQKLGILYNSSLSRCQSAACVSDCVLNDLFWSKLVRWALTSLSHTPPPSLSVCVRVYTPVSTKCGSERSRFPTHRCCCASSVACVRKRETHTRNPAAGGPCTESALRRGERESE